MLNSSEKNLPPGLIRIAGKKRPSKNFFILLGISFVMVLVGFLVVYFYNTNYKRIEYQSSPLSQSIHLNNGKIKQHPISASLKEERVERETEKKETSAMKVSSKVVVNSKNEEIALSQIEPFPFADYLYRAQDYEHKGLLNEAIREYKEYVNRSGRAEAWILNKIAVLYLLTDKINEANHYAEMAIKTDKSDRDIMLNYAVIKAKMGELDRAEESLKKLLSVDSNNKKALYNMALIKEKRGQYIEALAIYERLYKDGDVSVISSIERLKAYR